MLQRHLIPLMFSSIFIGASSPAEDSEVYPKLTTQSGRHFLEVKVLKIEPDSITIMHKEGGCRLKTEDLSPSFQKKLGISFDDAARAYRERRLSKQSAVQKNALQAQQKEARKRQRAMISRIIEQQELELSQDAKVKVVEKHADGYLCKVVYPITIDVTKQVTTTLGARKIIVVGKKTIYPNDFEAELIYLLSEKPLSNGREYPLRILHDQPYSYTNKLGDSSHIQMFKVITP